MSDRSDRTDAGPGRRVESHQESLEDLVAGAFGRRRPAPEGTVADPEDTLFAPPAAAAAPEPAVVPPPVEMPDPEPEPRQDHDEPPRRRSLWERLQVSPAVIVASLLAGVTGAAADHWFEEMAGFVGELRAAEEAVAEAPVIDIPPADVAPSDFSAEEEADLGPSESAPAPAPAGLPLPASTAGVTTASLLAEVAEEGTAPAEAEPAAPANRVRLVTWDERQSETVVTFWGNGRFLPERVVRFRVEGGAPRELLKLRGIDLPYRLTSIDVGTPELARIRTGFHPQDRVNELHVVLDLAHPDVEIARTEGMGDTLRVHLRTAAGPD